MSDVKAEPAGDTTDIWNTSSSKTTTFLPHCWYKCYAWNTKEHRIVQTLLRTKGKGMATIK
jgi:hypothetical protein